MTICEEVSIRSTIQVLPHGDRIGLVILSTDHGYTLRPLPGTHLTIDPAKSDLQLPVVVGPSNARAPLEARSAAPPISLGNQTRVWQEGQ